MWHTSTIRKGSSGCVLLSAIFVSASENRSGSKAPHHRIGPLWQMNPITTQYVKRVYLQVNSSTNEILKRSRRSQRSIACKRQALPCLR